MGQHQIPLNEVETAVQSAVQNVLSKHNIGDINKLWIGFVAPENVATSVANEVAAALGKGAAGKVTVSVATAEAAAGQEAAHALPHPVKIIGLIYDPHAPK